MPTAEASVRRVRSLAGAPMSRPSSGLCGLEEINHHTLSDFRVGHDASLSELFVQVLGVLSAEGLVSLERVMHDGTRIKAHAGADSFRREERLKEHLEAARKQVEAMGDPREEESTRKRAAQERALRERQQRLGAGAGGSSKGAPGQAAR